MSSISNLMADSSFFAGFLLRVIPTLANGEDVVSCMEGLSTAWDDWIETDPQSVSNELRRIA
jgi:hypothetical protein